MKRAVLLGLTALFLLGWAVTIEGLTARPAEYNRLIETARQYESDKIYVRAIEQYKEALTYRPDSVELHMKIAGNYLNLGDEASFVNKCNSINSEYGYPVENVTVQADYYIEKGQLKKAIDVLQKALKKHKNSPELNERYESLRYTYTDVYLRYDEILSFRNNSAVVVDDGRYGLVNTKGKFIMKCTNEWLGPLSNDGEYIPVLKDGEYYYANSSGYRIEVPGEGQRLEHLGVICNGAAPAKINGAWGYINERFEELSPFGWEAATVIQNGAGAVKQGGKWALIDSSYDNLTDYIYEDIKCDDYGYCSISGRIFAKAPEGYIMLDNKGQRVGTLAFEDAVPFVSEEPAAVKMGGRWGFVNLDGEIAVEPQFDEAGSFSYGLAPVRQGADWGYINETGTLVIDSQYTEARSFYKGVAPVKEGNTWTAIELNIKK